MQCAHGACSCKNRHGRRGHTPGRRCDCLADEHRLSQQLFPDHNTEGLVRVVKSPDLPAWGVEPPVLQVGLLAAVGADYILRKIDGSARAKKGAHR